MSDVQQVIQAFQEAARARQEERDGAASCDQSWGYFGQHVIQAAEDAERRAGDLLTAYIDARITALTGAC